MHWTRISKHGPKDLSEHWIDFDQVGERFNGEVLTELHVRSIENRYAAIFSAFLAEVDVVRLQVTRIADRARLRLPTGQTVQEGDWVDVPNALILFRWGLQGREYVDLGCPSLIQKHGFDLYVYVGSSVPCPHARALTKGLDFTCEEGLSP